MFGIGAFARLGQVSVRTLRYYGDLGLLEPAEVDEWTGYRGYAAEQLARLNRILALRDLGFALEEIKRVLDEELSAEQLRGMLRLRQAEARERLEQEAARLARVDARLRQIEREGIVMSEYDIHVKELDAVRVAALRGSAAGPGDQNIGPVLRPLYPRLGELLAKAGIKPVGPAMALYEDTGEGETPLTVIAAMPIGQAPSGSGRDFEVLDVPATRAATTVHQGDMASIGRGFEALMRWAESAGERVDGCGREVYVDCDGPEDTWVTELQFALAPR